MRSNCCEVIKLMVKYVSEKGKEKKQKLAWHSKLGRVSLLLNNLTEYNLKQVTLRL